MQTFEHLEDRRLLAEIPIPNAGFEVRGTTDHPNDTPIPQGQHEYPRPEVESWRYFEAGGNGGPARIVHAPTEFVGTAAEGSHVVRVVTDPRPWVLSIGPTAGVAQILDDTFDPTMTYELTAQVSRYTNNTVEPDNNWNGYVVQLAVGGVNNTPGGQFSGQVIGGTVIAEDWNTQSVPFGNWVTSTVTYTPDPADAALAGEPLQIRLLAIRDPDDPAIDNPPEPPASNADFSFVKYAAFDDVRLFEEEAGDDTEPPQVLDVTLNADKTDPADLPAGLQPTSWARQRSSIASITVTFSEPMNFDVDDIRLTNLGIDAPQDPDQVVDLQPTQFDLSGEVLTLSFDSNALPDGVYRLEVLQSAQDLAGNPLDGNGDGTGGDDFRLESTSENKLYQLLGEWNGDGGVSIFDFATFSYWFGEPAGIAPIYVDLNTDGGISIFDFAGFSGNFGVGIVRQDIPARPIAVPTQDLVPTTQRKYDVEQRVDSPLADLDWALVGRRQDPFEQIQERLRIPHKPDDMDFEDMLNALANDILNAEPNN